MNTLRNTVSLIGRLGKDPIIKSFGNDNAIARFSVATNESYKDKNGEWITNTTWHNIVAWGTLAERCKNQLKKGSEIILEGKVVNDSYETKDGEKRFKTEVSLRQFMALNRENDSEQTTTSRKSAKA